MKPSAKKRRIHPDTIVLLKQILLGLVIFSIVGLLITGIWYGTRVSSLNIQTVTVTGGETISHELLKQKVEEQLQGSYIKLVPRSFAYMYPEDDIKAVLSGIERVKNITIRRKGTTELQVSFSEYVSDALWCNSELKGCVFVDDTGFAFSKAPELSGGAFVRFVSIGSEPVIEESLVGSNDYKLLKEVEGKLRTIGWYVKRIDVDVAEDAYLTMIDGGEIKITLKQSADEILGNLETVLASEEFSEVEPGNFKYIDLRFGNKVFVNRTEEEIVEEVIEDLVTPDLVDNEQIIVNPEPESEVTDDSDLAITADTVETSSSSTEQ